MGHLPEYLMAPTQLWNLEVPALAVARHFARTLATLGDGNYNMGGLRVADGQEWGHRVS